MHYRQKTSFMGLYEELSKLYEAETAPVLNASNVTSLDALKRATEFIKEFTKEHPTRIRCIKDGQPVAIHVPTLVEYYLNQPIEKEIMDVLLKTYFNGTTLGKNPDPNHPYRSVQYLYNAIQQEQVMANNGFTRNGTATNAGKNVEDPYEWLVQRSSGTADFKFNGITVEAKQGTPYFVDSSGLVSISNSHDAQYAVKFQYSQLGLTQNSKGIVEGTWLLYRLYEKAQIDIDSNGYYSEKIAGRYQLVEKAKTDLERGLIEKITSFNKSNKSLELVKLK